VTARAARSGVCRGGIALRAGVVAGLAWLACLGTCPESRAASSQAYRVEIEAPAALKSLLEANLDLVRWSTREAVGEDQIRQLFKTAPRQVRELLATEGYFSPGVESHLGMDKDGLVARLQVSPGEPTRVTDVQLRFTGELEAAREAEAREGFGLKVGSVFRQPDWATAKAAPLRALQRRRYAGARLALSEAEVDPPSRSARLKATFDVGHPFRFGTLRVTGLQRYPRHVVANLNPIAPGTPYDEAELLRFQRRLQLSGYFASVIVSSPADPAMAEASPIDVTVVEGAARRLEAGAGLSTDRGPRAQIQYTDKNAFDRALRFSGGLRVDRLSHEAVGGLSMPRNAAGRAWGLEGKSNFQDIQGEQRSNWSATLARTYTIETEESQQSLQFLTERRVLARGEQDNRQALFLMQTWRWNDLDDILAPRNGRHLTLQIGGASRGLLSTRSFYRTEGRATFLKSFSAKTTLVFRTQVGAVFADSRDNIPAAYLYRTGGDASLRGYALDSLGVEEGGAIVGGRYLAVASLELIRWLKKEWGAAVFTDAGNAVDDVSAFKAVHSVGVGARWSSPVGSLNLDVAYGEAVRDWRLHFGAGIVLR
jgi:translocation and assembly module TamA